MAPLDDDAVEAVYRRLFPMLASKCTRMLGESAEAQDVAQETFTRLWRERQGLRDPATVTAWLYRTATRIAVDRLRSRRHESPALTEEEPSLPSAAATPETLSDVRRQLRALADRLPADELEAVILSRADGLTQPEIAEVLGVSERTVRRLLVRSGERIERFVATGGSR